MKIHYVVGGLFVFTLCIFGYQHFTTSAEKITLPSSVIEQRGTGTQFETRTAERFELPLRGSAPTENVKHSIAQTDVRQGCFRQDCIPAVDEPQFVFAAELADILDPSSIGIALSYKGEDRYYPFPMLETHELVNDKVAGDPLLISYCPLCGTGIVFSREVAGTTYEFGVSGMLWNSNLLMYNRAQALSERNLWSQVLGEAVVGDLTGMKLTIIPSDIMTFAAWQSQYPDGKVLTTGAPQDPYNQQYYQVAQQFNPNFDETMSSLAPDAYVYGIEVDGQMIAVTESVVANAPVTKEFNGVAVSVSVSPEGRVSFTASDQLLADVEGFWFSLKAAHPEVVVWDNSNN